MFHIFDIRMKHYIQNKKYNQCIQKKENIESEIKKMRNENINEQMFKLQSFYFVKKQINYLRNFYIIYLRKKYCNTFTLNLIKIIH